MGEEVNGEGRRRRSRWTEKHRQTIQARLPLEIQLKILQSLQRIVDLPAVWLWSTKIKAARVFQDQNQAPRLSDMVGIHTYSLISYLKCKFFFTWAARERTNFLAVCQKLTIYLVCFYFKSYKTRISIYVAYWMTGSAGKRGSMLSSSSAALSFFPVALLRDVLSFFASFLGVFVIYKDSSVQQLYTSTFTWKSGLASSLKWGRRKFQSVC